MTKLPKITLKWPTLCSQCVRNHWDSGGGAGRWIVVVCFVVCISHVFCAMPLLLFCLGCSSDRANWGRRVRVSRTGCCWILQYFSSNSPGSLQLLTSWMPWWWTGWQELELSWRTEFQRSATLQGIRPFKWKDKGHLRWWSNEVLLNLLSLSGLTETQW